MSDIKISALPGASTLDGAETIPLVQGGTTKKVTTNQFLIKDASGNVGVGTATTTLARATITNNTAASAVARLETNQSNTDLLVWSGNGSSGALSAPSSGRTDIRANGAAVITLTTNSTERARIDGAGNLGIGTNNPAAYGLLAINGASASANVNATTGAASYWLYEGAGTARGRIASLNGSNGLALFYGTTEGVRMDASGNLGLGVTPSAWGASAKALQILSRTSLSELSGYSYLKNNAYTDGATTRYLATAAASQYIQGVGTHYWNIAASGTAGNPISFTQAMTLDASGNLLVGTTSPSGRTTSTTSGSLTSFSAVNTDTADATSVLYSGYANGAYRYFVYGNGNVVNSNNSYGAYSDLKLKENITDASPKLSKLMQVRIVNYNLKSDPDKTKLIGVVAQELEQVSPGLIEETADYEEVQKTREVDVPATEDAPATTRTEEYTERVDLGTTTKSVKYSVFVPMLIKGMQEQQAQIEALEARLAALEAK